MYSAGETTYNLDTAGGLRIEVQKYYELIDALRWPLFYLFLFICLYNRDNAHAIDNLRQIIAQG